MCTWCNSWVKIVFPFKSQWGSQIYLTFSWLPKEVGESLGLWGLLQCEVTFALSQAVTRATCFRCLVLSWNCPSNLSMFFHSSDHGGSNREALAHYLDVSQTPMLRQTRPHRALTQQQQQQLNNKRQLRYCCPTLTAALKESRPSSPTSSLQGMAGLQQRATATGR